MDSGDVIVALVVAAALSFDFTNGFHDTANAMATTIATGALRPRIAVTIAAILNFVGAFISGAVAGSGVGRPGAVVNWRVAGNIVVGSLFTLPMAAAVAALAYGLID